MKKMKKHLQMAETTTPHHAQITIVQSMRHSCATLHHAETSVSGTVTTSWAYIKQLTHDQ